VPPDVLDYFKRDIERAKKVTTGRAREKLRQKAVAAEGNNPSGEYDEEDEVQRAIRLSRAEEEYHQGVLERGGQYECGEGSGSGAGNPFQRMFKRAGLRKETPVVVENYILDAGGRRGMVQPRIDTGS
jgi:hypothetical protein